MDINTITSIQGINKLILFLGYFYNFYGHSELVDTEQQKLMLTCILVLTE